MNPQEAIHRLLSSLDDARSTLLAHEGRRLEEAALTVCDQVSLAIDAVRSAFTVQNVRGSWGCD